MKDFTNFDEIKIGMKVIDTYNDFMNKKFKFIEGEKHDLNKAMCEIVDKTTNSVCVSIKKFPLRINKDDGALTNPVTATNWFETGRNSDFFRRFKIIEEQDLK